MKNKIHHVIADCLICTWHNEDYGAGIKEAKAHARKTGHRVEAEIAYSHIYHYSKKK